MCVFCGAMRCDAVPVIVKQFLPPELPPKEHPLTQHPPALQPCRCMYPAGERSWLAAQADAARRAPRSLTLYEYMNAR